MKSKSTPAPPSTFSLRRLELSMPFTKAMKEGDPKAMVSLAAICLADDTTLKLYAAGNENVLVPFVDQVHAADPFEIAKVLASFTAASTRYSQIMSGLPIELVDEMEAKKKAEIRALLLPAASPKPSEATKPL